MYAGRYSFTYANPLLPLPLLSQTATTSLLFLASPAAQPSILCLSSLPYGKKLHPWTSWECDRPDLLPNPTPLVELPWSWMSNGLVQKEQGQNLKGPENLARCCIVSVQAAISILCPPSRAKESKVAFMLLHSSTCILRKIPCEKGSFLSLCTWEDRRGHSRGNRKRHFARWNVKWLLVSPAKGSFYTAAYTYVPDLWADGE